MRNHMRDIINERVGGIQLIKLGIGQGVTITKRSILL